jgi:hypothetical protein
MKYKILIRTKDYKEIDTIEFESENENSINEANLELEKYEVYIRNYGGNNIWLSDQKNFVKYPMRNIKEHGISR